MTTCLVSLDLMSKATVIEIFTVSEDGFAVRKGKGRAKKNPFIDDEAGVSGQASLDEDEEDEEEERPKKKKARGNVQRGMQEMSLKDRITGSRDMEVEGHDKNTSSSQPTSSDV
jgi:hypothetical protein